MKGAQGHAPQTHTRHCNFPGPATLAEEFPAVCSSAATSGSASSRAGNSREGVIFNWDPFKLCTGNGRLFHLFGPIAWLWMCYPSACCNVHKSAEGGCGRGIRLCFQSVCQCVLVLPSQPGRVMSHKHQWCSNTQAGMPVAVRGLCTDMTCACKLMCFCLFVCLLSYLP